MKQGRQQPRIAVLYGKNGSGKSTLGEALSILGDDQTLESVAPTEELIDHCDLEVIPLFSTTSNSSDLKDADGLVFNERFIEHQVKLKRDGLETVVLLGEQVQAQEELDKVQAEHRAQKSVVKNAESELENAIQHEETTFKTLQKKVRDGWAQRQKLIRRNSGASPAGKDVVSRIAQAELPSSYSVGAAETLSERISDFLSLSETEPPKRPWISLLNKDHSAGVDTNVLKETLEAPTGSGIAERVSEAIQSFTAEVHRARELFSDDSDSYCPLCLQDTSARYKQELLEAISAAIDDKAQKFSDKLDRSKLPLVEEGFPLNDARFTQEAARFNEARLGLNSQLQKWNDVCGAKKLAMYSVIDWDSEPIRAAAAAFLESVSALDARANEIDQAIRDRSKRQAKLEADNVTIARIECDALVNAFKQASERLAEANNALESERQKLAQLALLEADLSARLMNAQVAVDDINASLRAIFAEDERLALTLSFTPEVEPHYVLRARGRAVQPNRLSIGERNIVALAYFFVSVRRQLDELAKSGSSRWLIIGVDDPVSSMDMDNRLGIHGFLNSQIQRIFTHGPTNVKMVLLTHDLGVARELEKASTSALLSAVKERNEDWNWNFHQVGSQLISKFELSVTHRLVRVDGQLKEQNDYGKLINAMWKYATEPLSVDDTLALTIGNVTRRVLEAFSTFIYNESSIPSQKLSDEYARITSGAELIVDLGPGHRMFLHENSHSEDRLTAMSEFGGIVGVDFEEQVRHVSKVLAFMFTLQPYHVTTFIKEDSKITTPTLERWCSELLGQNRHEASADISSPH